MVGGKNSYVKKTGVLQRVVKSRDYINIPVKMIKTDDNMVFFTIR